MMIGFPVFMVWLWLSITFYEGYPLVPTKWSVIRDAWAHFVAYARPTEAAALFYIAYTAYTWFLAEYLPGPVAYGPPMDPNDPGSPKVEYVCNAAVAWYITLLTAAICHLTKVFDLVWIADNFGHLMTTGILLSIAGASFSLDGS
jgi:Delta24(24(1))-sterol reductase